MALFNPSTKGMKNWSWASGGCSILAEIGTLHLEYSELNARPNLISSSELEYPNYPKTKVSPKLAKFAKR